MKKIITKKINNNTNVVTLAVIGASLAGLTGTAYFFLGPKGKKHQKHTRAWAIKMKGDVIEKLEKARVVSEPLYHEIIDTVALRYEKEKKAGSKEIQEIAQDLKKHWGIISREAKALRNETVKSTKKVVKKVKKTLD